MMTMAIINSQHRQSHTWIRIRRATTTVGGAAQRRAPSPKVASVTFDSFLPVHFWRRILRRTIRTFEIKHRTPEIKGSNFPNQRLEPPNHQKRTFHPLFNFECGRRKRRKKQTTEEENRISTTTPTMSFISNVHQRIIDQHFRRSVHQRSTNHEQKPNPRIHRPIC